MVHSVMAMWAAAATGVMLAVVVVRHGESLNDSAFTTTAPAHWMLYESNRDKRSIP